MFRREVTGIFLAIAASILVLFSSKEVFLSVMILAFLFLLYELIKVTKKFNGLFWIQIFFTFFTFFFLPVFEKMRELFFLAISISALTDAGAYYVGVKIGKTKIFPKTSPNKTLEGLIGGNLIAVFFTAIIFLYFSYIFELEISLLTFILFVWISSIASICGDYLQSKFKRSQNIKDSGNILPGHGGISDRVDSHIVCLPIFFSLISLISV